MTDELVALNEIRDLLKNNLLNHPIRTENLPQENVIYEGYAKDFGITDDSASWFIVKKETIEGVTSTLFAYTDERDDGRFFNKKWSERKKLNFK